MDIKNNWQPTDTLRNTDVNNMADAINSNTDHQETKINEREYVHGLKYDKTNNQLKIQVDDGEVAIGGAESAEDIPFEDLESDLSSDNISDAILEVNEKTNNHINDTIIDEDGVHGIKYEKSSQLLKYKEGGDWQEIPTGKEAKAEVETHKAKLVAVEGVHGIKYDILTKQLKYQATPDGEWLPMEIEGLGDVLVEGLTADNIKAGITVVVTKGDQEISRIEGAYTADATATANDILQGTSAYANGNRIDGQITTRTGDQVVSVTSSDNDYIKTGTIANAYYKDAVIAVRRGNLQPQNIKTGVNVLGITGNFTADATATASDIVSGKSAYVNGSKINGTINFTSLNNTVSNLISKVGS